MQIWGVKQSLYNVAALACGFTATLIALFADERRVIFALVVQSSLAFGGGLWFFLGSLAANNPRAARQTELWPGLAVHMFGMTFVLIGRFAHGDPWEIAGGTGLMILSLYLLVMRFLHTYNPG